MANTHRYHIHFQPSGRAAAGPRHMAVWRTGCLAMLLLTAAMMATGAHAAVDLRVEARPIGDPIEASIKVTDSNGDPVSGLTANDFTVREDGIPISFAPEDLSLPPSQAANTKVSVIFVLDNSGSTQGDARIAIQDAVTNFINTMNSGDYAAIIKFNDTNPDKASIVQPFTEIDGGAGNSALISALMAPYPGIGTNLLDAIDLAVSHYNANAALLPSGPKAVIVITDGGENQSSTTKEEVILDANTASLPLFTIGVGDVAVEDTLGLLDLLPTETGGDYIETPDNAGIADAYASISELLNNEYLVTYTSAITDCSDHTLEVSVTGQPASAIEDFSRCSPEPITATGGGGGGGAIGIAEILVGFGALAIRRRRRG